MARREPATSSRARGKVHSVQAEWLPPAKMVKKLACQLQAEEVAVEEVCQGRDVAILEVVMETAGLLTYSQLEGLGAHTRQVHPEVAGPSHPSAAVVAQPPVVVAWPPHSPLLLVVEQQPTKSPADQQPPVALFVAQWPPIPALVSPMATPAAS